MQQGLKQVVDKAPRPEYALWSLFLGLSCVFLWSAFSGPRGAMEFLKLRGDLKLLEAGNKALLLQNQALQKEIDLLRNSPAYVEKVAREEYGYIYPGEKITTFSDDDPGGDLGSDNEGSGVNGPLPP